MRENFDDRVKGCSTLINGNLIVKLENDECVEDFDKAKSINIMPFHVGSYFLSHSKRLLNDEIRQTCELYNNSIYYTDTDSLYIRKEYWSNLADNGFVGKSLGLCKNN